MGLPVGIVFRRLHAEVEHEQAQSLLGPRLVRDDAWTWFGLWDVAAGGTGLLGAAAVRSIDARVVELCACSVLGTSAVEDRLLREVADAMRAAGAEQMIARLPREQELLLRAGFQPAGRQDADDDSGALVALEL
jgi:hypothetical protein